MVARGTAPGARVEAAVEAERDTEAEARAGEGEALGRCDFLHTVVRDR